MKEVILIPSYEPDDKLITLIKSIDKKRFDVVVIDDGSGKKYENIFNKIENSVYLISYAKNRGKGYALKKGLSHIKDKYIENYIVITMDSDGQHKINDAIKLSNYVKKHTNTYALGMRKRNTKTPIRSKIGNSITKYIYSCITKNNIYDTQTGLRCFTSKLTDFLLSVPGNRFEYEMNCLLMLSENGIRIHEIEITTIYINNNKESHFKILHDSFLIYRDILKFSFYSIIPFCVDYLLFILLSLFLAISHANILGKSISLLCSYVLKYIFNKNKKINARQGIILYLLLSVIIIILDTLLLNIFVENVLINKYIAKIIVEIIILIISYLVPKKSKLF